MNDLAKKNKWIYIMGAVLAVSYVMPVQNIKILLIAAVFYSSYLFNLCNPTLLYLTAGILVNYGGNSLIWLIGILPMFLKTELFTGKNKKSDVIFTVALLFSMILSYAFGTEPRFTTMILYFLCYVVYRKLSTDSVETEELFHYGLCGMLAVFFALFTAWREGGIQIMYGRLAIGDSIRTLANAMSISMMIYLYALFCDKKRKHKFIRALPCVIAVAILILTLSRGAIISTVCAFSVLILTSDISVTKKLSCILIAVLLLCAVVGYMQGESDFRTDRLFETDTDGFGGRERIWATYLNELKSKPSYLAFGFGAGDVKRLGISASYSHSLMLDVLFSYGIFGFTLFLGAVLAILKNIVTGNNKTAVTLAVFGILMFSTHSTSTDTRFYILLAAAYLMSGKKEEKQMITGEV